MGNPKDVVQGAAYNRECRIRFREDSTIDFSCSHTVDSIVEDQSGRALIEHMTRKKYGNTTLDRREICWWPRDPTKTSSYEDFDCFKEWRQQNDKRRPAATDPAHLKGLNVVTISVSRPYQVLPALKLLDEALELAPILRSPLYDSRNLVG